MLVFECKNGRELLQDVVELLSQERDRCHGIEQRATKARARLVAQGAKETLNGMIAMLSTARVSGI